MSGGDFSDSFEEKDVQILSREDLETAIRRRTAYLENVMDTMVDLLLRLDAEGNIELCNQAATSILGYDPEEIQGKPVDVLFADPEDEELSEMLDQGELFDRLFNAGQVNDLDVTFVTKDGETIPMSLSASVLTEDGRPIGIVCLAKDISERKKAQERAEFLHSLLRHDLSNKLQVVNAHLRLLEEHDLPDGARENVEKGLDGVDEAMELIQNVRTLSSIVGEPAREPIDVAPLVRQCISRLEALREQEDVEVEIDVDENVTVLGGSILNELFDNLIENALYHSAADTLRIRAEKDDETVLVCIEDDGEGIPDAEKGRVMQKGEKGAGSTGSGLGLHLASEIAESYGGSIRLEDSSMGGARFDVRLPRARGTER